MKNTTIFIVCDHLQAAPFVDLVDIKVIGGKGGNGNISFFKKPHPKAVPGKM